VFEGVRTTWPVAITVLLLVAVIAPICEEVVYRGLLWGALEQRWGRVTAVTVSTLVFALAHLEPQRAPLLLVVAIPIALARLYSGSLWGGIIAHHGDDVMRPRPDPNDGGPTRTTPDMGRPPSLAPGRTKPGARGPGGCLEFASARR